ncbi:methylated-DNA--[protein]-cysteine S-methyltransferase [Clostridium mediterraneense]|uniref:methylated-DNA--[protein]-cysteine S-methyltransferase n=1 Tax=Clostridium mediterraneense TaxID=1805472 RepID=UPI00082D5A09|nr:methylated-DNA--[protein]-cysteine S-methyltransferase [Clostridium mediterraneense]
MKSIYYYNTKIGRIAIIENSGGITNIYPSEMLEIDKIEEKETKLIKETAKQLNEYLDCKRKEFTIPLAPEGTDFQKRVWNELIKIPFGTTVSYKDIAEKIGNPKAARAVGMANNKNPILIIVPCHRVIGSNGNLTGYACGIEIKKKLLNIENPRV